MKISKKRLKEIIKEELETVTVTEQDDSVAYEALANAVGDLIRNALEELTLSPEAIRDSIGEALSEELGDVEDLEGDVEDEISGEEELVLRGPSVDPLGDSLQARRQRASVRGRR